MRSSKTSCQRRRTTEKNMKEMENKCNVIGRKILVATVQEIITLKELTYLDFFGLHK
jgi:hypothetical protein